MCRNTRTIGQLVLSAAIYLPLLATTYYVAFLLRFAGQVEPRAQEVFLSTVLWLALAKWVVFLWFRMHQGCTRFVGFHDMLTLGKAVTCGAVFVTLFDTMCLPYSNIPRSVIVIDWGTTLLAVGMIWALPRLLRDGSWHFLSSSNGTATIIVGANEAGEALLRAIRQKTSLNYRIIGFTDDRPQLHGHRIAGVKVLGGSNDLPHLANQFAVGEVLVASGELPGRKIRELVESGRQNGFRVKIVPSYDQLLAGHIAVRPREVAIEDLLCRESVQMDIAPLRNWLTGRVIMITGSAGSIGSEICRQLLKLDPARLVLVDRSETGQFFLEREMARLVAQRSDATGHEFPKIDIRLADLTDPLRMACLFEETKPEIIFHAAAYKHVPLMETHCCEAVRNIVLATRNMVELADTHEVQAMVMISTDKAVNPTSVMGACKRIGEQYVQARAISSSCRMVTVRFGNVLDSSGSVVPVFREQIALGGPVTVTHPDITRYFMLIPEAAQLVIQAGAMGQGGEVFVLDMGEPVRILDLAHDMIRLSGLRVDDDIEVHITGLRPGEKLHEELYDITELHERTSHPKIMVAESSPRHVLEVIRDVRELEEMLGMPNDEIKAALHRIASMQRTGVEPRQYLKAA